MPVADSHGDEKRSRSLCGAPLVGDPPPSCDDRAGLRARLTLRRQQCDFSRFANNDLDTIITSPSDDKATPVHAAIQKLAFLVLYSLFICKCKPSKSLSGAWSSAHFRRSLPLPRVLAVGFSRFRLFLVVHTSLYPP
jgi:hypothetical protein